MKDILRKFGFTRNDLLLIIFLLTAFTAGLVIKFSGWNNKKEFDYSQQDKRFEQYLSTSFSELKLSSDKQERLNRLKNISDSLTNESDRSNSNTENLRGKKININLAYASDLELLPGIGKVTAERIIEYREGNNGFRNIEELMNVKGIGQKKFDRIKDYITAEDSIDK